MKRILILLSGVAVVVALAWAWQMGRMRADAQAAVLELGAQRAAQDADLHTVSTRIADAEK